MNNKKGDSGFNRNPFANSITKDLLQQTKKEIDDDLGDEDEGDFGNLGNGDFK